ncbi:hypothetical protein B7486_51950 [cyanobacterium TDX16]|nr:hypothetical protein B7486_51950 [cyanobacterium TDX16]
MSLRSTKRWSFRALATVVLVVAAVGLSGCGSDDEGSSGSTDDSAPAASGGEELATAELDVTSIDYGYELAETSVPAGAVTITQDNQGDEPHQATAVRLEDGQTVDDLVAGFTADGDTAFGYDVFAGGPNGIGPGDANETTQVLEEGQYAFICFIPDAEGTPHYQSGMAEEFEVTANDGTTAPELPTDEEPVATVTLVDFAFEGGDELPASGLVEVVNDGAEAHELTIVGGTEEAPEALGGLAAIAPGESALVPLDLEPGVGQLICYIADEASGQPHFLLGMQQDSTFDTT